MPNFNLTKLIYNLNPKKGRKQWEKLNISSTRNYVVLYCFLNSCSRMEFQIFGPAHERECWKTVRLCRGTQSLFLLLVV